MSKQLTIAQIQPDQETDYQRLYKEGIKLLQKYSGDIWTDYNEHDPGITILGILCYVLTESFDRAGIDVETLLAKKNGGSYTEENACYTAASILHNAPLTINDYRKFIIDRVDSINNVWIKPYYCSNTKLQEPIGIVGLYEVLADLEIDEEDIDDDEDKKRALEQTAKEAIVQTLNSNRVFTELFSDVKVTILKKEDLIVFLNLYVDGTSDVEEVLAELFFTIGNFIRPGIRHYSYQNMLKLGFSVDEIFEGPQLRNGFINTEDLTEKIDVLYFDDFSRLINKIPGVKSINNLNLYTRPSKDAPYTNTQPKLPYIVIGPEKSLVLNVFDSLFDQSHGNSIQVFINNVAYHFDKNLVLSKYNELVIRKKKTDKFNYPASKLDIGISEAEDAGISDYYSLQNDFPLIYGIGEDKLSQHVPEARKVQALQLKSYLLFFEQLLSDFNKQVASTGNLFSVKHQKQTFFYQDLYPVPDVAALLKGFEGSAEEIYDSKLGNQYRKHTLDFKSDPANEYLYGLKEIYQKKDDFFSRRNLFLDHLLARFGFSVKDFVTYSSNKDAEDIIVIKEELLKTIPDLTALRGRAISQNKEDQNISTLNFLHFFHLLSDIRYKHLKNDQSEKYRRLSPHERSGYDKLFDQHSDKVMINLNATDISSVVFTGLFHKNYSTSREQDTMVLYLNTSSQQLRLFEGQGIDYETAEAIINDFTVDFLELYSELENLFVIDHILLLPPLDDPKFVLANTGESKEILLKSATSYPALLEIIEKNYTPDNHAIPVPEIGVINDNSVVHQDFYSSRISIYVLNQAKQNGLSHDKHSDYLNSLFIDNLPAHIRAEVVWVPDEKQEQFMGISKKFKTNVPGSREALTNYLLENNYTYFIQVP